MKFKHMIIILILLCFAVSLSAVSAIENVSTDNVSAVDEEGLEVSNTVETIDDLNIKIQNATPNSTVKLENDLIADADVKSEGIEIPKRIILDGQGHKIDGNSTIEPFFIRVHGENVVLKNIVFANWNVSHSYNLVEWIGPNGKMENCTFINNTAFYGGAVDWTGINGFLINCTFINNTAENGGALYWYGLEGTIAQCIFSNNTAEIGGAVYISGRDMKLDSSKFEINSADDMGGAVYSDGLNLILSKNNFVNNTATDGGAVYTTSYENLIGSCNFTDNTADESAGALYLASDNNTVKDSIFTNNRANAGGAIYSDVNANVFLYSSKFIKNSAKEYGGAIMIDDNANIINATFENNSAGIGGAVYSDTESVFINSTFTNNTADSGGAIAMYDGEIINSTFTKNFANETGGAIYATGDLEMNKISFSKNNAGNVTNNIYSEAGHVAMVMNMQVDITNITYGDALKVRVRMPNNITKGKISVRVNGKTYSVNLTGNQVTVSIPNLESEVYDVQVLYEGDEYNSTTQEYEASVFQRNVKITAAKKSFIINYAGKYSVTVKRNDGKVISGEQVTFYINNNKIKTVTTSKKGVATVAIASSKLKSLKTGTKTLKVTLSSNYNPNSKSVKITINKEKTKIVAKKKAFKKSLKTKKYTITLKNSKNKVLKKVKVKLKVKGKTYTVKTNKKGKATFKITNLKKKGKFTAKITFKATKYYKGVSKKVKLTIK